MAFNFNCFTRSSFTCSGTNSHMNKAPAIIEDAVGQRNIPPNQPIPAQSKMNAPKYLTHLFAF
jgi:hypothetical protein